ncbi:alpha/beta fold hydrolase [Amycolatopsis viridis]|uniref:Pimeloyl-ACP methyl ester carboxylesterase n=1 Tax=Amycolatopsis viridis TaxID=185678 RepID=A0ABX0SRR4_9PSEU|nr:alpha/beta hydrolase [Amycolatopsis viridis]NIH79228.1 pimeloyl-ACP methyl ester carboxylesterase [Amycolatopsis viridis]
MTTRQEIVPLTFGGFTYEGRKVHGSGGGLEPVVLVGGAFQRKDAWGRVERDLLGHADVITADLPGWGTADRLPPEYGVDFLADALDHLLDHVAPGPVHLVGASYGTGVAHRWAQLRPDRVRRVLLVGTMTHVTGPLRERIARSVELAEQGRHDEFTTEVLDLMLSREAGVQRQAAVRRCLTGLVGAMTGADVAKYLDNTRRLLDHAGDDGAVLPVPVLVTTGEHDPLTTPRLSRAAAARCADARFTAIRGADHLVHLERPAEIVDLALRFFRGETLSGLPYCTPVEHVAGGVAR